MKHKSCLSTLALLTAAAVPAHGALTVNQDLGTLGIGGTATIAGDTSTGANNADIYLSAGTSATANWGNELVFQFAVPTNASISLTSNSLTGDPDAFLLTGLGTAADGGSGKTNATAGVGLAFLDGAPPETAVLGSVFAGTYYISIDSFIGFDGSVVPADAVFDYTLSISALAAAPVSTDLGVFGDESSVFTVDSLGSLFDTELALFDALGNFLDTNDDEPGGSLQSELSVGPLSEGTYYLALSGWDTGFGGGFTADALNARETGAFTLNHPNGVASGDTTGSEVAWFQFQIVPEPGTVSLLALAGLGLLRRRRS